MMTFDEIIIGMQSSREETRLEAIQACRKLSGSEENNSQIIDEIIDKGIVQFCVEFLKEIQNVSLQYEACWVLTNVTAGMSEQTQVVIKHGAIPELVSLLYSSDVDLVTQAAWVLANIVGDRPEARDLVIVQGTLPIVIKLVTPETHVPLVREIIRMIANLCRFKDPALPFGCVEAILPLITNLLSHTDPEVLDNTCQTLSYLTNNDEIQGVIDAGAVPKLVKLLGSQEYTVLTAALQPIGNIVTGNSIQIETVIAHGALNYLRLLLNHERHTIVEVAAWVISNIAAGNCNQKQKVIEANVVPLLIQVIRTADIDSQKEATWAISNLISEANVQQIAFVFQCGALEALYDVLKPIEWKYKVSRNIQCTLSRFNKLCKVDRVSSTDKECGFHQEHRIDDDYSYLRDLRMAMCTADAQEQQTVLEEMNVDH